MQDHLEACQGVVAQRAVDEGPVCRPQGGDVDVVVQHDGSGGNARKLV